VEIDEALAARARELLADRSNVSVIEGDAMSAHGPWASANKVIATFALARIPDAWLERLADGGVLVAPVGPREAAQRLVRVRKRGELLEESTHGAY
jgi:protein-L-isoaspartate(D-aspartate) O-methyltransferase